MTTIYLMRHSEPMKKQLGIEDTNDSIFNIKVLTNKTRIH